MNKKVTTSVIISVYKNVNALEIILDALYHQSIQPIEIIISEDCESSEMKTLVSRIDSKISESINIVHLSQEDSGWRKNRALNRAIVESSSEYLIFIDGDVVPHPKFIEGHLYCSEPKREAVGKRCELGQKYSQKVYDKKLLVSKIAKNYLTSIVPLHQDKVHHYEDGIYSHFINKVTSSRYIRHIIGCNFSCYKEDFLSINGFNEDFINPAVGEDVDITWRFRGLGIEMKSCRYIANVYHLWHKKGFDQTHGNINQPIMDANVEKAQFITLNGIKKYKNDKLEEVV
jgi:GT2 family glycosyltransferase